MLVSDIGMPGEDGYSLMRKVRALPVESGGKIPASPSPPSPAPRTDSARSAGFQHHLSKPVEPGELMALVASLAGARGVGSGRRSGWRRPGRIPRGPGVGAGGVLAPARPSSSTAGWNAACSVAAPMEPADTPPPLAAPRSRIFVVDDSKTLRVQLQQMLKTEFDCQAFSDGPSALEAALAQPPDLILSDVVMEPYDGYELCRRVREQPLLKDVPLVLLTSSEDRDGRALGLEQGADDYLAKPVHVAGAVRARALAAAAARGAAGSCAAGEDFEPAADPDPAGAALRGEAGHPGDARGGRGARGEQPAVLRDQRRPAAGGCGGGAGRALPPSRPTAPRS